MYRGHCDTEISRGGNPSIETIYQIQYSTCGTPDSRGWEDFDEFKDSLSYIGEFQKSLGWKKIGRKERRKRRRKKKGRKEGGGKEWGRKKGR